MFKHYLNLFFFFFDNVQERAITLIPVVSGGSKLHVIIKRD